MDNSSELKWTFHNRLGEWFNKQYSNFHCNFLDNVREEDRMKLGYKGFKKDSRKFMTHISKGQHKSACFRNLIKKGITFRFGWDEKFEPCFWSGLNCIHQLHTILDICVNEKWLSRLESQNTVHEKFQTVSQTCLSTSSDINAKRKKISAMHPLPPFPVSWRSKWFCLSQWI